MDIITNGAVGVGALAEVLRTNHSLVGLSVGNCWEWDDLESLRAFAEALSSSQTLTDFVFSGQELTRERFAVLIKGLERNRSVIKLSLQDHAIGDEGLGLLLTAMACGNGRSWI